ncbi:MAG TPA: N-6 DNA methylase [Chitinophagales bacterium]|nr:N-6 DNA methylase [Chitinophagales bacterium]
MESVINSIRNILRKEGVTGMDSINHCIMFIISRMLNKELCEKLDIDKKFIFKHITKDDKGEELGNQDLYNKIYNGSKECLIGQIMLKLGFENIKFKLDGIHNLKLIYDKLKELNTESLETKYDLIGTIYELHLKSGTSNAMRDLGQYYTHRLVIQYMIELCDPQMKNDVIEKIVDPTMGTGGFLTMCIKYLNKKYKNMIDWQKNKDNIIGFDIDDNVKNMALLNIFLEIGELCTDTLIKQDTLHNDMKFKDGKFDGTVLEKADVILANEPMGLKNIVHATLCHRIKNIKIIGTKAEPLFLQLFMESLNDGGRCAVIVPDGVLFNESNLHKGTRKHLIENFNLHKVVSLNDDFFLNTNVKTSILFFIKDGSKTKEVDFCEIKIKDNEIKENSIIKVKYDKIKEANYSLFVNKYNAIETEKIEGIEYKKLGNLLEKKSGKSLSRNNMKDGEYPVISGGTGFGGYHNEFNYNEKLIFIARVGTAGNISKYEGKCFVTDLVGAYKVKEDQVIFEYIYYYLKQNESFIKDNYVMKTGAPSINLANFLEKYEIPIPSLAIQEAIVEQLDVLNSNIEKSQQMIDEYRKIIKHSIDCQTKNEKKKKNR